jgi:hypothetical protein
MKFKSALFAVLVGLAPSTVQAGRPAVDPEPPATIIVDPWYMEEPHPWDHYISFVVDVSLDPKRQGAFVTLECFEDDGDALELYTWIGPYDYVFPTPATEEDGYCTARLMVVTSQGGNRPGIVTYPAEITFRMAPFEIIVIPPL